MKKIIAITISLALMAVIGTPSFGQIRKIPGEVTDSFTGKYPGASGVEWKDKLTGFTASFTLEDVNYKASFDNDGKWENTEQEIATDDLPELVQDGFEKSKYADWELINVHKIELPQERIQYRIGAGKGDIKKRNLLFSDKGRLLKDNLTL